MAFLFTNKKLFDRVASKLEKLLAQLHPSIAKPDFHYADALAITLGFDGLSDYAAAAACARQDPLFSSKYDTLRDEELTSEALCKRRKEQALLLEQYFLRRDIRLSSEHVVEQWQPTAARPQNRVIPDDESSAAHENGVDKKVARLLRDALTGGKELTSNDIKEIRYGLAASRDLLKEWLPLDIGSLACKLYNTGKQEKIEFAIALWEMIAEAGYTCAYYELGIALLKIKKYERAVQLFLKVKKALDAGEEVFVSPLAKMTFYSDAGRAIFQHSRKPSEKKIALHFLKIAANNRSKNAPFFLSHVYFNEFEGEDKETFSCPGVTPNKERALYYFQLAIKNGLDPSVGIDERAY